MKDILILLESNDVKSVCEHKQNLAADAVTVRTI